MSIKTSTVVSREAEPDRTRFSVAIPVASKEIGEITRLRATPEGRRNYVSMFEEALALGGTLSEDDLDGLFAYFHHPSVSFRVSGGVATLVARDVWTFDMWKRGSDGHTLMLPAHKVANDARLTVTLRLAQLRVTSVQPLPTIETSDRELVWVFGPGRTPKITVTVRESVLGAAIPAVTTNYFALALPFLAVLLLRRSRRRGQTDKSTSHARPERAVSWASVVGILLALGATGAYGALIQNWRNTLEPIFGSSFTASATIAIAALLPYLIVPSQRRVPVRFVWCVAAGVGLVLAIRQSTLPLPRAQHLRYEITGALCFSTLVFATINASAEWLAVVTPELASWWRARVTRLVRILIALTLTGAFTAQALLAGQAGHLSLLSFLPSAPLSLVEVALAISGSVVAVGLAMSLWRRGKDQAEIPFDKPFLRHTLLIAVVTVVIGTGGKIHGYAAPVAYLLGLTVLLPAIALSAQGRVTRILAIPGIRARAPDLLRRARKVTLLERRKEALADDLAAQRITEEEYDAREHVADDRLNELQNADVLETAGIPDAVRRRELRTIGLATAQDLAARLDIAAHWGSLAVAIPFSYSLIASLSQELPHSFSRLSFFGGAFLLCTLLGEAIAWPIAAFAFVALYPWLPGRNGPTKGVIAALAIALPIALASTFVETHFFPRGGWPFLATELALLFASIGALIDYRSVREAGMGARQLGELYRITGVRSALVYLLPLLGILYAVLTQLSTGKTSEAVAELASHASSLLPTLQH